MSTFEDNRYRWRETYFVLFPADRQPKLKVVEKCLSAISKRYLLSQQTADAEGGFESLTLAAPEDFAALDICYTSGAEVAEQVALMVRELAPTIEPAQRGMLKRLKQCDGRFDVLHFEQVADLPADDEEQADDELLDPSALLAVLEALARITDGVAVDPQSGTILSTED
ncbi:MAG: hypothetical protein ABSF26_12425 [Thermoguttaceae bacterium]|jgi:hypothetical protein